MVVSVMWVRFTGDFDYRKPSFTVAYKAGMTQNVTTECADVAVAAGKAVRMEKPNKGAEPVPVSDAVVMPPETKVEEHGSTDDAGRRTEQARNFPAENDSKG